MQRSARCIESLGVVIQGLEQITHLSERLEHGLLSRYPANRTRSAEIHRGNDRSYLQLFENNPFIGRVPPGTVFEDDDMHSWREALIFRPCKLVRRRSQSLGIV